MKISIPAFLIICCISFLFSCTKTDTNTGNNNSDINNLPKIFGSVDFTYSLFYDQKNRLSKMVKVPFNRTYTILDVDSVFFYYNPDNTLARMVKKTEFVGNFVQNAIRRTATFFEYSGNKLTKIYAKRAQETEPVEIYNPVYELELGILDHTTKVNYQYDLVYDQKNRLSEIYSWLVQVNYPGIILMPSAGHYTKFSYMPSNDSLVSKIEVNSSKTALPSDPSYNDIRFYAYDPAARNPLYNLAALQGFPLLLINMLPYDGYNIPNASPLMFYVCLNPYLLKNYSAINYYFNGPSHHYYTVTNTFYPDGKVFSSTAGGGIGGNGFSFKY